MRTVINLIPNIYVLLSHGSYVYAVVEIVRAGLNILLDHQNSNKQNKYNITKSYLIPYSFGKPNILNHI